MMTGRALNYQLRGNTGPDTTFLKIVSKIRATSTLLDVSFSAKIMKTIDLGIRYSESLMNTNGDI